MNAATDMRIPGKSEDCLSLPRVKKLVMVLDMSNPGHGAWLPAAESNPFANM